MRSIYFHRFLASPPTMADVSNMEDFWYINRINVPEKLRGRGYGRQLLNEIIADADADRVVLVLDPLATGGLSTSHSSRPIVGTIKEGWYASRRSERAEWLIASMK
jgi:GNAT superfamily N-acetyltransferase